MTTKNPPIVLTIAGSDSSAGAGIQADLKTISATGGYACTVITCITAQNTMGVIEQSPIPTTMVRAQINAIFDDFDVQAVKIGMLGSLDVAQCVFESLLAHQAKHIVCDPIMRSSHGQELLSQEAKLFCLQSLFPLCTLLTPNLLEYRALKAIRFNHRPRFGSKWLLIKGGHKTNPHESIDDLIGIDQRMSFHAPRIQTNNSHGTGCTLSSAIACFLAQGKSVPEAVDLAKSYLHQSLVNAISQHLGHGTGPLNHFPRSSLHF